ncbi:MAG: hypothetical protein KGI68_00205 [Alphaproteobacteria bacterium]|nr:hypothetical protein [Alphaproteobacteria bacterium]MDE1985881.1 hypothetical protein [Alphaproteobacteria bacterium]MDE2163239.1 hypothetical protein [Alphaproteobacteria bacterium]MDE2266168.1 hypothetical protein [Alphaproteobacteria bacterium]MDE2498796.1 hypothetical protein [Alphaproteobacteria bacterium]
MSKSTLSVCLLALVLSFTSSANAQSAESGKIVSYAVPAFAVGVTVWKRDWTGLAQLTVVTALSVGTAYGLKQLVRERRPYQNPLDHSTGWDSFPSTTSALAAAPSSFLWSRYGWEWGLPTFIVSKYVPYSLDKARKNRIWDGLASTVISWGYNELITTRYHKPYGFYSDLQASPDGVFVSANYRW